MRLVSDAKGISLNKDGPPMVERDTTYVKLSPLSINLRSFRTTTFITASSPQRCPFLCSLAGLLVPFHLLFSTLVSGQEAGL